LSIIDCLIFLWEHRLNAGSFKALPAVPKWSDFDDCHDLPFCVVFELTLNVQANMIRSENGQSQIQSRRLKKDEWAKLKRAFVFGHSLGAISQATGISRGTLSARSARHKWSQDRAPGTEILRKGNDWK
jgi:hypothetical protein